MPGFYGNLRGGGGDDGDTVSEIENENRLHHFFGIE